MIELYNGDCLKEMQRLEDDSVDLVFTSPPYAERRVGVYNSIAEEAYIEWFLPIASQIKRVLKPTGSFFLNLKAHTNDGERSLYVMELVIALKKELGFNFIDELCWIKQAYPGKYHGRFKNGFEPIYHFTKGDIRGIMFNPMACGTEILESSTARAHRAQCGSPTSGSGMNATKGDNMKELKIARPSNVIKANNILNQYSDNKEHPATFPEELVEFFVKSYSNHRSVVLDPFMGSGTTGMVCKRLSRDFIGIELNKGYYDMAEERIEGFATLADLL